MIILAIDTSCDDTSIAVVEMKNRKIKVLSNIISSQEKIHKKYGGVYPTLAKREHAKNLPLALKKALKEAKMLKIFNFQFSIFNQLSIFNFQTLKKILIREPNLFKNLTKFLEKYEKPKVNAIAVTIGPGLEPCLWTGVNFAKALSYCWNLPIIPVNHIEGHILANFLPKIGKNFQFSIFNFQKNLPAICLVASGGHTQIILMKKIGKYKILGETRDDAAGECFDKTARILGLGYPGGLAIAQQAEQWKSQIQNSKFKIKLPRPMIYSKDYDFSFSGLKTAVLYAHKKRSPKIRKLALSKAKVSKQYIQAMCAEIQQAVIDVLLKKTIKAAKDYRIKTIMLGGGVAANDELRKQFQQKIEKELLSFKFYVPSSKFCTDNAAMLGITAHFHRAETKPWKNIKTDANLRI